MLGIFLFLYYILFSFNNQNNCNCDKNDDKNEKHDKNINDAYNMQPSEIFNSMFTKPSVWQGYDAANVLHKDNKYI
jgi:hypothetical protein